MKMRIHFQFRENRQDFFFHTFVLETLYTTDDTTKLNKNILFCEKYLIVYNQKLNKMSNVNFLFNVGPPSPMPLIYIKNLKY